MYNIHAGIQKTSLSHMVHKVTDIQWTFLLCFVQTFLTLDWIRSKWALRKQIRPLYAHAASSSVSNSFFEHFVTSVRVSSASRFCPNCWTKCSIRKPLSSANRPILLKMHLIYEWVFSSSGKTHFLYCATCSSEMLNKLTHSPRYLIRSSWV